MLKLNTVWHKLNTKAWRSAHTLGDRLPIQPEHLRKLELLINLVQRQLTAQYKGSVFGNLWPLLQQIAFILIYTYVFSIVLQVKLGDRGIPMENSKIGFGLWLFAGILPWSVITGGLHKACGAVISQKDLVRKVIFPIELLPLVPVSVAFIESTVGSVALIIMVALLTQTVYPTFLLLPLVWIPLLLFTAGIGYLVAGLTVFLRDIPQALTVILRLWFYATPILYPAVLIPDAIRPWMLYLNPVAAIVGMHRDIILVGEIGHWFEWSVATAISALLCAGGFYCYQKLRPAFADVL
ncbi:MAG: ABC transporter permease [Thainema sp.]